MKKVFMVIALLLISSLCHAAPMGFIDEIFVDESIATFNTLTSQVFNVKSGGYFGCWMKADITEWNGGKSNLNVWAEMSHNGVDFAVPYGTTHIIASLTTTEATVFSINPPPMQYMRLKVEGVPDGIDTGNTTGTTLTMYMFRQE